MIEKDVDDKKNRGSVGWLKGSVMPDLAAVGSRPLKTARQSFCMALRLIICKRFNTSENIVWTNVS